MLFDPIEISDALRVFLSRYDYPHDVYTQLKVTNFVLKYITDRDLMLRHQSTMLTFIRLDEDLQQLFATTFTPMASPRAVLDDEYENEEEEWFDDVYVIPYSKLRHHIDAHLIK